MKRAIAVAVAVVALALPTAAQANHGSGPEYWGWSAIKAENVLDVRSRGLYDSSCVGYHGSSFYSRRHHQRLYGKFFCEAVDVDGYQMVVTIKVTGPNTYRVLNAEYV